MMLTSKQRDALQNAETALMADWHTRWHEKHANYQWFNADGIVDHKRWAALPDGRMENAF